MSLHPFEFAHLWNWGSFPFEFLDDLAGVVRSGSSLVKDSLMLGASCIRKPSEGQIAQVELLVNRIYPPVSRPDTFEIRENSRFCHAWSGSRRQDIRNLGDGRSDSVG